MGMESHRRDPIGNVRMSESTLCTLSATEIAERTNVGALSCEDVARACLARIEAREPPVKAWSFIDADLILRQAKALDAMRSMLHFSACPWA